MSTETLKQLAILKVNEYFMPNKFCRSWFKLRNSGKILHEDIIVVLESEE